MQKACSSCAPQGQGQALELADGENFPLSLIMGRTVGDTAFPGGMWGYEGDDGNLREPETQSDFLLAGAWTPPHLDPFLCPSYLGQPPSALPLRAAGWELSEDPGSPAPGVCCPFKGMVTADTGYWRVGAARLGNQPEGAIWSKLLWDPCHGVFTGPAQLRSSPADSPSELRNTALCSP